MRKLALLLVIFMLPSFFHSHAIKIGTTPSPLTFLGDIGMQIDTDLVEKEIPFNVFTNEIGSSNYGLFKGEIALALLDKDGEIKQILRSIKGELQTPYAIYGGFQFLNVSCTVDVSASDIIRFITLEDGDDTWLPVESATCEQPFCKITGNKLIKSKITVNVLGKNPVSYNAYCFLTDRGKLQTEPIRTAFYQFDINWPEGKNHRYKAIAAPGDPYISYEARPNDYMIHGLTLPEYTITLMACSDDELITEQRHYTVETPGTLREQLINDKDLIYINNISVSGTINDDDIAFMRKEMPMLEHIDLSNTEIVGGMLPNNAFDRKEIKSLKLPKNIRGLGANSLSFTKLTHLDIPKTVTYYGLGALNSSSELTTIVLHNPEVIPVSWCDLYGTNRSNGILFVPEGTREQFAKDAEWGQFAQIIEGDNADDYVSFRDDTFAYSGVYPNLTLSQIIQQNFYKPLIIPETVQYNNRTYNVTGLGESLTRVTRVTEIHIPKTIKKIGKYACGGYLVEKIEVDPENSVFFSHEGVLYNRNTATMLEFPTNSDINEYVVPDGIKNIEGWACYSTKLRKITLPSSIEQLGPCSFENASSIDTVICKAITPPVLGLQAFGAFNDDICFYVPEECVAAYKADGAWGKFSTILPIEKEEGGVNDVVIDNYSITIIGNSINVVSNEPYAIYSIDGKLFYKGNDNTVILPRGFYIIKINGAVKKIKI